MFGNNNPKCPRCNKTAYAAESVMASGKSYHSSCFTCVDCNTRLASGSLSERNGDIYCSSCYAKNFGPKGFNVGSHSVHTGVSVADIPSTTAANSCSNCKAANQTSKFCGECGKSTSAAVASSAASTSSSIATATSATTSNNATVKPSSIKPSVGAKAPVIGGGGDKCAKCSKTVYAVEKVIGGGKIFHEDCFKCEQCNHRLNSTNVNDNDGKVYCNICYAKSFGPKGFSQGVAGMPFTQ